MMKMRKFRIDKNKVKEVGGLVLSMLLVVLYPCIFIYANNIGEGRFRDIWPAFFKLLLVAVVVLCFAFIVMRDLGKAWLWSEVTTIIMINFHLIYTSLHKIFPAMGRKVFSAIVLLILFALAVLIKKKVNFGKTICGFLGILFGALIAMNIFKA